MEQQTGGELNMDFDNQNAQHQHTAAPSNGNGYVQYGGFWRRVLACVIDSILLAIVLYPLLMVFTDFSSINIAMDPESLSASSHHEGSFSALLIQVFLPILATVLFWIYRAATPGKMAMGLKIVDARTGEKISTGQAIGRYFAYFISALPFCLGYLWVAFDKRKQGWHDKLAGTVVIKG